MRGQVVIKPKNGDVRTVNKFALLPVVIGTEWRWLERVVFEQEFNQDYVNYESFESECWYNKRFVA